MGRALVLSDVQGNFAALEAVLADAKPHVSHVTGLGDFASGPEPGRVIDRLRSVGPPASAATWTRRSLTR